MSGICNILGCFFGSIRNGEDGYTAVQVYPDGNPIDLGCAETEDEADWIAIKAKCQQLENLCERLRNERDEWKDRWEAADRDFSATLKAIDREDRELRF